MNATDLKRRFAVVAARAYRRWAIGREVSDVLPVMAIAWKAVRRQRYCLLVTQRASGASARVLDDEWALEGWDSEGRRPAFRTFWHAFWPHGPEERFVNLECTVTAVEVWDGWATVAPAPFGRRSARIERDATGEWQLT